MNFKTRPKNKAAANYEKFRKTGAHGHLPFAVPASHMVGVVINFYWPPNRWTSFR